MNNVLKFGKKVLTASVVGTTILWSLGVAALVPAVANAAVCPTLNPGDMIKVVGHAAIYSVNTSGKVLYFPSGDEFKSWTGLTATASNQYAGYITVNQDCFDSLAVPSTYPGAVNFRAGSYVVKRPSSDQLYVVEPGNTLAKISLVDAKALYGTYFKTMTVADAFWPHYVNRGADVMGMVHPGMLVSNAGKTWYVDAGMTLREVTANGMTANRFKAGWVHAVAASYLAGTTVSSNWIDSTDTTISNRTQDGAVAPGPVVTGGSVTASLASDNPAAANLADGSAYNSVLKLTLSASAGTNVTGITLTKTGLIANSNVTGVSVWDSQGNRHGDVMTALTSDNKVTVSFGNYPIALAAGGSETLLVKANISSAADSGLVGFNVAAHTDIATNGTVGGSFPIVGNQMSIVDGSTALAAFTITGQSVGGASSQPLSTAAGNLNIGDLQKEVSKIRFSETSGNEDMQISRITFYVEGSVQDTDLANWSVYAPDGSLLGNGASLTNRYVTVKFNTPYTVAKSTNRDLSVKVDVVGGSTRNFRVHVQNDYDVMVKGVSTGFYVLPTSFSDVSSTSGWFNMGSGTLTVNKNISSPSLAISAGASNIVLARFDVKAVGENMQLQKMGLSVANAGPAAQKLTGNITVRDAADGTVYLTVAASTASLYTGGVQNNLSTYLQLTSNQTRTLEVVGNVDSVATSGNKYTVGIGDFYGKRLSTLDFNDAMPSATVAGTVANQLSVNTTALNCFKDTAMGNTTVAPGATTVIGQYICTAGPSEDIRLSNASFSFGLASGQASNMFQNLTLWNGTQQLGTTLSTVASTSNAFSYDLTIPANQTVTLKLQALVVSGASGVVTSSLASYNFNGKNSGTSGTGTIVPGQQVTVGAGNLNITAQSDATTISKIYGPSQSLVQVAKWKFAAANDDVTLNKLTFTARNPVNAAGTDQTTLGTFGGFSLFDGSTHLADASYVNGDVVFTGLADKVTKDNFVVLTLKATTNASGVLTSNSTTAFVVKSDSNTDMEARSAAGALLGTADINFNSVSNLGVAETRFATSTAYFFHDAYPVVTVASTGSSLDFNTTQQILKFTLTNAGTRELRVGSTTVSISASGLLGTATASGTIRGFRLYEDNGTGGLGTLIAGGTANDNADVVINSSTAGSTSINFNNGDDANSLMDNLTVSAGSSRSFIVTADTSNMGAGRTTTGGNVTLSAKISGSTGFNGTTWSTGNLFYFYTPATSGALEQGPFSQSDSYDIQGTTMSHNF